MNSMHFSIQKQINCIEKTALNLIFDIENRNVSKQLCLDAFSIHIRGLPVFLTAK